MYATDDYYHSDYDDYDQYYSYPSYSATTTVYPEVYTEDHDGHVAYINNKEYLPRLRVNVDQLIKKYNSSPYYRNIMNSPEILRHYANQYKLQYIPITFYELIYLLRQQGNKI